MKSTRSRSRSKNNRNRNNAGQQGGNVVNRVFDSSGPEGKVRGTPQQVIEKYNQLARDAQLSNDRVAAENFQQHAEHYLRLLSAAQREQEQRREEQERVNRERQADRDRERAERQERDGNQGQNPNQGQNKTQNNAQGDGAQRPADPGDAPQPDVVQPSVQGAAAEEETSSLVDTPESKPKPKRAPRRKPKPKPEVKADAEAAPEAEPEQKAEPKAETVAPGGGDQPEAAE